VKSAVLPRRREQQFRIPESFAILFVNEDWNWTLRCSGERPPAKILAPVRRFLTSHVLPASLQTSCKGIELRPARPRKFRKSPDSHDPHDGVKRRHFNWLRLGGTLHDSGSEALDAKLRNCSHSKASAWQPDDRTRLQLIQLSGPFMFLPLLAELNNLLCLNRFVSRAAFRVQELQRLWKSFCIGGVAKEIALTLYTYEVFRFKLF
jgi:hypothetical protein